LLRQSHSDRKLWSESAVNSVRHHHRLRPMNRIILVAMLLCVVTVARADVRRVHSTTASATVLTSATPIATATHSLLATTLATLPPEEKPKTHWPWWLRILAVVGVLVFIRLVAGSVRNNPGKPGPS
jgi:hypothetical protein